MSAEPASVKGDNRRLLERERHEGRAVLASYPMQVQLEATNRCNLACASCARNYYSAAENPDADMDPARFPELETLFAHAERVLIGGYGEPLMGAHTEAILRLAARHGCFTEVITNATYLSKKWAHLARDIPIGRFLFSVDAASEKGLRALRGVTLSSIVERLRMLADEAPQTESAFNFTLSKKTWTSFPPSSISPRGKESAGFSSRTKNFIRAPTAGIPRLKSRNGWRGCSMRRGHLQRRRASTFICRRRRACTNATSRWNSCSSARTAWRSGAARRCF
ncbi:MAG: radical SAM protein [Deltaproteobacteria bacterium]|nr:radical SAM protein [Deltaproteobacteria bacterium]